MSPTKIQPDATELASAAVAARDATIPPAYRLPKSVYPLPKEVTGLLEQSGLLSETELAIVDLTAVDLARAIADRKFTAIEVAKAYCKAAAIAQQATNCLVELFEGEALERAAQLDAILAETGKVVGPLHGVPVSVKDHVDVQGHDSPSGFLGLVGKQVAEEDAHAVRIFRDAGAVFYCKTTNPQSLMMMETRNYLGVTCNPHNTDLTCGGSSGGEGAILGMRASPLGTGTDIGGSIRAPAGMCGVFGFKPTAGVVPLGGLQMAPVRAGWAPIMPAQGPMARSVEDLELYMKVIAAAQPWREDPDSHVRPWVVPKPLGRKLRVGILRDDGVVRPLPPVRRALDHAVEKLRADGNFELVEFNPYKSQEAWDILASLYFVDNGQTCLDRIADSGEPIEELTAFALGTAGDRRRTIDELLDACVARDVFRKHCAKHWHKSGVDVVLGPVTPNPAPQHNTSRYWRYTAYWNLTDYPGGVFPTGLTVDPALDKEDTKYQARNEPEEYVLKTWDAQVATGAPIPLQVVGFSGLDEETMAALKQISAVVRA